MKQRSVENVFSSIGGLVEPPSDEEAPKLVNQRTANERTCELFIGKMEKEDSNIKYSKAFSIQTESPCHPSVDSGDTDAHFRVTDMLHPSLCLRRSAA